MGKYRSLFQRFQARVEYWRELAFAEFAVDLSRRMEEREMSRKDLSARLNTSRAYVTKALRGDANLTIESLVRFALAVDGVVHIHIADPHTATTWTDQQRRDGIASQDIDYGASGASASPRIVRQTVRVTGFAMGQLELG